VTATAALASPPAARLRPPARRAPRMLLPPPPEPTGEPLTVAAGASSAPALRSVWSPLTEQHWPLAAPAPEPQQAEIGDPRQICGAVVLAAVEALRSARPLSQLIRWVSPDVLESLAKAALPPTGDRVRAVIRGQRICRISPTVAEGSVVIHDGARVRAAAVRMEVHRGSWRVTVLHIG
jgi:hypothetical protein